MPISHFPALPPHADLGAPHCIHDGGKRLLIAGRQLPFRLHLELGPSHAWVHILVEGIPTLTCQVCAAQTYDLDLLAHIEATLQRHLSTGVLLPHTCTFSEVLALSLLPGSPPSAHQTIHDQTKEE